MADSGRVPHAMLFYENEGCGGLALALAFIQYLNCKTVTLAGNALHASG